MIDTIIHEKIRDVMPRLTFTRLDPQFDAALVHRWVIQPRARFWMMSDLTLNEVREIYEWIDTQTTHHAWLVRCDGTPCAIFQTYTPTADPIGEVYPTRPDDLGIHVMIGPDWIPDAPHLSTAVMTSAFSRCLADPNVNRLIADPDIRNFAAIRRFKLLGFKPGRVIDLPQKKALLVFLSKEGFTALPT